MVRATSIVLGAGLIALWLIGLGNHATPWLTWVDGLAALCAFGLAAAIVSERPNTTVSAIAGPPIFLAVALYVFWIAGLATHATAWLSWWTFVFACAFLVLGLLASTTERQPTVTHTS
jgi:hypothetical protein